MPKVTEEHVAARRRQILAAALRCFAREGFHRTTMQDIFRESELSPGAVYSYFTGKEELVRAIIGELMGFVAASAAVFREPLPDGRLRRPGEALAELIGRYQTIELGTVEERARLFPHLVGEQLREGFATLARAAQERGELDGAIDPDQFGRLAISLVQGLLIQYAVYGPEVDIDAYARAAVTMVDGPGPLTRIAAPEVDRASPRDAQA